MKALANVALRLLTGVSTVFIAACYGIPREFRTGKVVDAQTKAPIPAIVVSCLDSQAAAIEQDATSAQGEFVLPERCFEYRAEDVDAAENGSYATKTVPDPADAPLVIEMDPAPQG
jgi:hypothetical protein